MEIGEIGQLGQPVVQPVVGDIEHELGIATIHNQPLEEQVVPGQIPTTKLAAINSALWVIIVLNTQDLKTQ